MYLIRMFIGIIVCRICFLLIKRFSASNKRRMYIICVVSVVGLLVVSMLFPPENLLWPFDSPKAAYRYMHPEKNDVKFVISGKNCDLVVSGDEVTDEFQVIPRSGNGWGVEPGLGLKRIKHKAFKGTSVSVYRYNETSDYFVVAYNIDSSSDQVSDSASSEFISVKRPNATDDGSFFVHYANVQDLGENYCVTLGGETIAVFE